MNRTSFEKNEKNIYLKAFIYMGKLKIELNNGQNIRDLLQEAYKLADEQLIQAQNEINKMANATKLQEEVMDSKSKYGKIINDYLSIKDKAIGKKIEIAKLLSDIMARKDSKVAVEEESGSGGLFDVNRVKSLIRNIHGEENNKTKTIELNKK